MKYVSLELGGKNALIVLPDANLDKAIESAVFGMNYTATAGQSCGSTSRLLLHGSIADQVLEAVVEQVRAIRVGHPLAEGTQMARTAGMSRPPSWPVCPRTTRRPSRKSSDRSCRC